MQTGVQNTNNIKTMLKYLSIASLFLTCCLSPNAQDYRADFHNYFSADTVSWPDGLLPDDIICNYDGDIYLKSGKQILEYWENELSVIAELDNDNFKIFPAIEGRMYIVNQKGDSAFLYTFDADLNCAEPIAAMHDNIYDVTGDAETITFFASGKNIFIVSKDYIDLIYSDFAPINTIALTSYGIFFATDYIIGIVLNSNSCIPLVEKGAIDLHIEDNRIFALLTNGSIIEL